MCKWHHKVQNGPLKSTFLEMFFSSKYIYGQFKPFFHKSEATKLKQFFFVFYFKLQNN